METAAEIAARFGTRQNTEHHQGELERAILRHMEHHMLRAAEAEREACARVADQKANIVDQLPLELVGRGMARTIAHEIRSRTD